jgi:hypothetical protein
MDAQSPRRPHSSERSGTLDGRATPAKHDAGLGRFLYYVRSAAGGVRELQFGFDGTRFTYPTEQEALDAARDAARLHWEATQEPSGVYLVSPSVGRRLLDIFGMRR